MRILKTRLLATFFALATMSSCTSDVANRYYSDKKYSPKKVEEVEVLYSKPKKKFTVIADFQSRGESDASFAKRAAEIGADAIIVTSIGGYYSLNEESAGKDRYKHDYHDHRVATAIKY